MRAVHKRYHRELFPAMIIYVVLLLGSIWLLRRIDDLWLRTVVTLLPVLPLLLVVRAILRVIRGQDELERRIDLESIATSTALTTTGFFAYGLLLNAKVVPEVDGATMAIWVWPVVCFCYGLAKVLYIGPLYRSSSE
jgi:hypothetical protein